MTVGDLEPAVRSSNAGKAEPSSEVFIATIEPFLYKIACFFFYIKGTQILSGDKTCISSTMRTKFRVAKEHSYTIKRT